MKKKNYFWGFLFISVAIYLILTQLDIITTSIGVGSIIIGIICAAILTSSIVERSVGGVCLAIGLAWATFGEMVGLPYVSPWMIVLIMVLFDVGISILRPNNYGFKKSKDQYSYGSSKWAEKHHDSNQSSKDGVFTFGNRYGRADECVNSNDFKGADIDNSFGELKVYFDDTTIVEQSVEIRVNNSFGSLQLFVPHDWNVVQEVNVFAGSVNEGKRGAAAISPVVKIVGKVNFGELGINYL